MEIDLRSHAREDFRGLLDPLEGNVRVGVAGAEEDGRAVERPSVVPRSSRRTDQAAGECDDRAVSTRMASGVLASQAGALGKAEQGDAVAGDAAVEKIGDDRV